MFKFISSLFAKKNKIDPRTAVQPRKMLEGAELYTKAKPKKREFMAWVADQGGTPDWVTIGTPINYYGEHGKVVEKTILGVIVEWD